MTIEFTVPAIPVAQPRPRATSINGAARLYEAGTSHPVHAFKAALWATARQAYSGPPLDGPLSVRLRFLFPRPKATAKKHGRLRKSTKPDIDNCAKSVLDALNGLCYHDDGQVAELTISKWTAGPDEQPSVLVVIGQFE